MPDYSFELAARDAGYRHVCGIDEAGRGLFALSSLRLAFWSRAPKSRDSTIPKN